MKIAPLPDHEVERLAALRDCNILDTVPEAVFDNITQLASSFCGMPICLVCLVDADRGWFKSKVGLDINETPRDMTFCAHAILQEDILVIPDLLKDERFRENPFVTQSPALRFYAGAPLKTAEGLALGTLCVMDYQPRQLTEKQLQALRLLANQVMYLLEHRQSKRNQRLPEGALERFLLEAQYGMVIAGPDSTILFVNKMAGTIFGYTPEELVGQSVNILLPERYRANHAKYMHDFHSAPALRRMGVGRDSVGLRKDGTEIPIEIGLNPVTMGDQRYVVASITDITVRKQVEEELRRFKNTLDQTEDCVFMFAPDTLKFFYVNQGAVNLVGYSEAELRRMRLCDIKPEFPEPQFRALIAPLIENTGSEIRFQTVYRHKDGHDIPVEVFLKYIAPKGEMGWFFAIVRDITEHKHTEEALRESERNLRLFVEQVPAAADTFMEHMRSAFPVDEDLGKTYGSIAQSRMWLAQLTPREREVMRLLIMGLSNKAAARQLDISPRTVEVHRRRIMRKMGAKNIVDLILRGGM
jgi:PAS domain S-box-containing protein